MASFLTADLHLDHFNPETGSGIILNDGRPFPNIQTHDRVITQNINDTLSPGDELWILGDVAWNVAALELFFKRLRDKVQVRLIRGNHDDKVAWKYRTKFFHSAYESLYTKIEGHPFHLSHYAHRVWRNSIHGSFHAFGHSHGQLRAFGRSIDVGINCNDYRPISVQSIVENLSEKPAISHHPKNPAEIPTYLGNESEFKTFERWNELGYLILKGSKSPIRVEGVPHFHSSQVREREEDPFYFDDFDFGGLDHH